MRQFATGFTPVVIFLLTRDFKTTIMSESLVKSPMQLKYELDNINNELATLLSNAKKKRNDSLTRLISYRAELKELDAVMAATEEGYKAYLLLAQPILNLTIPPGTDLNKSLTPFEEHHPDLKSVVVDYLRNLVGYTQAVQEKEETRINQARDVYKTQSGHILRKTKEIYTAMAAEKQQNEAYAETLTNKIKETEEQLQEQLKISGMGIGL